MESAQATTERLQITAPSSSETAFSNVPKLVPPSAPIQLSSSTGPTPSTTLQATTPTPSAGALSPLAIAALSFSACAALFLAGISAYCCWLRRRRPKRPMVQSMAKASFLGAREAQEAWLHSPQSHSHAVAVACGDSRFQAASASAMDDQAMTRATSAPTSFTRDHYEDPQNPFITAAEDEDGSGEAPAEAIPHTTQSLNRHTRRHRREIRAGSKKARKYYQNVLKNRAASTASSTTRPGKPSSLRTSSIISSNSGSSGSESFQSNSDFDADQV